MANGYSGYGNSKKKKNGKKGFASFSQAEDDFNPYDMQASSPDKAPNLGFDYYFGDDDDEDEEESLGLATMPFAGLVPGMQGSSKRYAVGGKLPEESTQMDAAIQKASPEDRERALAGLSPELRDAVGNVLDDPDADFDPLALGDKPFTSEDVERALAGLCGEKKTPAIAQGLQEKVTDPGLQAALGLTGVTSTAPPGIETPPDTTDLEQQTRDIIASLESENILGLRDGSIGAAGYGGEFLTDSAGIPANWKDLADDPNVSPELFQYWKQRDEEIRTTDLDTKIADLKSRFEGTPIAKRDYKTYQAQLTALQNQRDATTGDTTKVTKEAIGSVVAGPQDLPAGQMQQRI